MSEKPMLNAKEHITDQVKSHEITPAEINMAVQRLRETNAAYDEKVTSFTKILKEDEAFQGATDKALERIAHITLSSWYENALSSLAQELGPEIADTLGISSEHIYQLTGTQAHHTFDWLVANDLQYSPSDLQTNPKSGRFYADEYKEQVAENRKRLLSRAEELAQS